MKAKKKPLETKTLADLGVERDDKMEVIALNPPPERAPGKVIEGETPAGDWPPIWPRLCMRKPRFSRTGVRQVN
jgi:hypothetical protein